MSLSRAPYSHQHYLPSVGVAHQLDMKTIVRGLASKLLCVKYYIPDIKAKFATHGQAQQQYLAPLADR